MSNVFTTAFEARCAIGHLTAPLSSTNFTAKIRLGTETEFALLALWDVTIKEAEAKS